MPTPKYSLSKDSTSNYIVRVTHPLRVRPFRLLFLGRTVSAVGDAVVPTALALAVLRATGSTGALALVLACAVVPRLLLLPLGGVLADRLDARRVAIIADLVRCLTQLCVGVELLGDASLAVIAVAAAAGGAAGAFALPTASPWSPARSRRPSGSRPTP